MNVRTTGVLRKVSSVLEISTHPLTEIIEGRVSTPIQIEVIN
jgi:hypothetical protein